MGRRTSFVAWISVTRPETMKMAFTMFDDNANGRPMAPATNTGSSGGAAVGLLVAVAFVRWFPDLRGRDASPIPDTEPVTTIR